MTSKSLEAFVNERRLRPIYDCLDNGNAKKALQEADKLLKKQKDLQCAKVLKGLALLRLGQTIKAMNILQEVQKEVPTDDCTLQAMAICYRELNRSDLIADAYENASKKDPASEDLMVALFMAYVRIGNFKKQQQTALNLYKLKPKNSYYFWAIMSVYMQAITNPDTDIANKMLLPLAQKMCKKFIDEDKVESEAEVELYLMILEKQEKYEEILKATDGPLARLLPNYLDFLRRRKAYLYLKTSRYQEAFETFRSLIDNNVDQLEYYQQLYEVAFNLEQSAINVHSSVDQVAKNEEHPFIFKVIETISKYLYIKNESSSNGKQTSKKILPSKYRAPYIARIELYETLKARCDNHSSYPSLLSTISGDSIGLYTQFFTLFGHKDASFFDFSYLFTKFKKPQAEICSIIDAIEFIHGPLLDKEPTTINEMYRLLCFIKLNYFAGRYSSMEDFDKRKLVSRLLDLYDHSIQFGVDLLPSDFQPPDPFVLVISYLLLNESNIKDNSKLLNLLIILERSLQRSSSNYNSKLALIKIYNTIGACGCSNQWFESMDIKHLQIDTLGYLISDPLLLSGNFSVACKKITHASRFYCANYKDTFDFLVSFYKIGSFTKIEEIMKLKERLNLSINYSSVELDKMVLALILVTKSPDAFAQTMITIDVDLDKIENGFEDRLDNRDLAIFRVLDNETSEKSEKNREKWFDDQLKWIKLRYLLLKTIVVGFCSLAKLELKDLNNAGSSEMISSNSIGAKFEGSDFPSFTKILEKLTAYYETLKTKPIYLEMFPLQGPQPSRINYYLQKNYFDIILKILNQLRVVHESSKEKEVSWDDSWINILQSIINDISVSLKVSNSFFELGKVLNDLSFVVETICFAVVLLGFVNLSIKKDLQESKKTKKKRNLEVLANISGIVENFNNSLLEMNTSLKFLLSTLDEMDLNHLINAPVDYDMFKSKGIFFQKADVYRITHKEIMSKLEQSYKKTASELHSTVSMKMKYLNSLKL